VGWVLDTLRLLMCNRFASELTVIAVSKAKEIHLINTETTCGSVASHGKPAGSLVEQALQNHTISGTVQIYPLRR
jgi:hypothetical protein